MGGPPASPFPGPQFSLAFARAAACHQHQQNRQFSCRIGQNVGRIGDGDPRRLGCFQIDVFVARAIVGDDPHPHAGRGQNRGRDLVRHRGAQGVVFRHGGSQLIQRQRRVAFVQRHVISD
ncbi:hypothetical protein D3C87_1568820 [compost metagenome]